MKGLQRLSIHKENNQSSVTSKVREKIVVLQLAPHLEKRHVLCRCQYGFHKNHATAALMASAVDR